MGFSESGRLQVDVKLASFATRARGRVQQVSHTQVDVGMPNGQHSHAPVLLGPNEAAGMRTVEGRGRHEDKLASVSRVCCGYPAF